MKLGSVFAEGHSNDSMFRENDAVHRFNPTYTMRALRDEFARRGIELHTADLLADRPVDFELHIEGHALGENRVPRFLVALENPYINPLNADAAYFANFRRVFSWDPRFFALPNVRPIEYGNQFELGEWLPYEQRDIFSCLINANKRFPVKLSNDLYVERIEVIRWHEQHAPGDFELYGMGWNKPRHADGSVGKAKRRLQRLATQLWGYRPFPSWRGELAEKRTVLRRARFSYAYENIHSLSGYVTEKIFDSMINGCVPVYWGADDVQQKVPVDCFVDRRAFRDTAETHDFLRAMTPEQYAGKQRAMRSFLEGEGRRRFSAEAFATAVADGVVDGLAASAA
jgi:glycosyl transferase family 10 (putative fucosyltransferase)